MFGMSSYRVLEGLTLAKLDLTRLCLASSRKCKIKGQSKGPE